MRDAPYAQYESLLRLLLMLEARSDGISLADIEAVAGVQRRAAERMRDVLLRALPQLQELRDGPSKRWALERPALSRALAPGRDELAALARAAAVLERQGDAGASAALETLADRLRAGLARNQKLRLEPDLEALLEADGVVLRPGPREALDPAIPATLRDAILRGNWVGLDLRGRGAKLSWGNRVGPIALLLGEGRQYLVGFSDYRQQVQLYRLANLERVEILNDPFARPEGFDLKAWLGRAFGTWQDEPQEVVWRFAAEAAAEARGFRFHPSQQMTDEADGSLTVRLTACGFDEMCWHLFRWGHAVRIIAPEALRLRYAEMLEAARAALDQHPS